MRINGSSEHHQNNNLKVIIAFGNFIGKDISFLGITKKDQILEFLNTKVKSHNEEDPDKRWIHGITISIDKDYFIDGYTIIRMILIMKIGKLQNLLE